MKEGVGFFFHNKGAPFKNTSECWVGGLFLCSAVLTSSSASQTVNGAREMEAMNTFPRCVPVQTVHWYASFEATSCIEGSGIRHLSLLAEKEIMRICTMECHRKVLCSERQRGLQMKYPLVYFHVPPVLTPQNWSYSPHVVPEQLWWHAAGNLFSLQMGGSLCRTRSSEGRAAWGPRMRLTTVILKEKLEDCMQLQVRNSQHCSSLFVCLLLLAGSSTAGMSARHGCCWGCVRGSRDPTVKYLFCFVFFSFEQVLHKSERHFKAVGMMCLKDSRWENAGAVFLGHLFFCWGQSEVLLRYQIFVGSTTWLSLVLEVSSRKPTNIAPATSFERGATQEHCLTTWSLWVVILQ